MPKFKPKKCEVCGKEFTPWYRFQKTCSDDCDMVRAEKIVAEQEALQAKKKAEMHTCLVCGKEFVPHYKGMRTCGSKECITRMGARTRKELREIPEVETCKVCGKKFKPLAPIYEEWTDEDGKKHRRKSLIPTPRYHCSTECVKKDKRQLDVFLAEMSRREK